MRLLLTVGIRLWDAVHAFVAVLCGTLTLRQLTPSARVKHAAALQNDLLEVASLMERMHAWTSRMAARDSRAAKKLLEEYPGDVGADVGITNAPAAAAPPLSPSDRKAMLRRYWTAKQFGLAAVAPPPAAATPETEPQLPMFDGDGNEEPPPDNGGEP